MSNLINGDHERPKTMFCHSAHCSTMLLSIEQVHCDIYEQRWQQNDILA